MSSSVGGGNIVSASLYVGDLHPDVRETILYEVFNAVGPVASIRVCRDSTTKRSLCYAYVNYHSVADAERALDVLNYSAINGVPCRIMWSHRDPALRKSGNGNIFVKNLDKTIDNKALYDTFSLFGNILSCKVCKVALDESGRSKGYGFVHYEDPLAAARAVERVNGMQIGTKTVYVGPFLRKGDRQSTKSKTFTNVYVKNIPHTWTDEIFTKVFSAYGTVTSEVLQRDARNRFFAFVNFEDPQAAARAVAELDGKRTNATGIIDDDEELIEEEGGEKDTTAKGSHNGEEGVNEGEEVKGAKEKEKEKIGGEEVKGGVKDAEKESVSDKQQSTKGEGVKEEGEKGVTQKTSVDGNNDTSEGGDDSKDSKGDENHNNNNNKKEGGGGGGGDDDTGAIPPGTSASPLGVTSGTSTPRLSVDSDSDSKSCEEGGDTTRLYVCRAQSKAERVAFLKAKFDETVDTRSRFKGDNLYIKNLDDSVDDLKLREAFEPFGTIMSAKVMKDERGKSRGFGFVSFMTCEEATKAVTEMHLKLMLGKPLYVGLAERREDRSARLQARYKIHHPSQRGLQSTTPSIPPQLQFNTPPQMFAFPSPSLSNGPNAAQRHMMYSVGGGWRAQSSRPFAHQNQMPQLAPMIMMNPMSLGRSSGQTASPRPAFKYNHNVRNRDVPVHGVHPSGTSTTAPPASGGGAIRGGGGGAGAPQHPTIANSPHPQLSSPHPSLSSPQGGGGGGGGGGVQAGGMGGFADPNFGVQQAMLQQRAMEVGGGGGGGGGMLQQRAMEVGGGGGGGGGMKVVHANEKRLIGERLFPMVSLYESDLAGKITGMMLEMDNQELVLLLENQNQLKAKIDEAKRVLEAHSVQLTDTNPNAHNNNNNNNNGNNNNSAQGGGGGGAVGHPHTHSQTTTTTTVTTTVNGPQPSEGVA